MSNPATVNHNPANLTIGQSLRFFVESKGIVFVGSFDVLEVINDESAVSDDANIDERNFVSAKLGLSRIHKTNFQGGGYNLMQYDWNEGTPYITEQQNGLTNALLAFAPMECWSQDDKGGGWTIDLDALCDMGNGWTVGLHEAHSIMFR